MKYITVPEAISLDFATTDAGEPVSYEFTNFLNEFVWVDPKWRNPLDPENQLCCLRLLEKFKGAKAGDEVELTDKDHERFLRIASLSDQKLPAHLSIVVMKMLLPISTAKDTPSPSKKEPA